MVILNIRFQNILRTVLLLIFMLALSACSKSPDQQETIIALQNELAELTARVQANEDFNEIANLQRIYGYYVDKGQWEQVADLFSDEGTMEIAGRGVFEGRERILEYLYHIVPGEENTTGLAYGTLMDAEKH